MMLLAAILVFSACSSDDETDKVTLSKTNYVMYHDDRNAIEGTNVENTTWSSDNEYVATIENNTIVGQYVGKTVVKSANKKQSFSVEVKPKYHTYEEPCLDWGATKSDIIAKYGSPLAETEDVIGYKTSNPNAPLMMFTFKNGKLSASAVTCKISVAYQLTDFLMERYLPIDVDASNYSATLVHCVGKKDNHQIDYIVGMQYNSSMGGINVIYIPNDSKTRTAEKITADFLSNLLKDYQEKIDAIKL